MQILLNVLLFYASLVVCGLQYLLYGPLGFLESEELYGRFIITTIETILAAAILRLEIDGCFMLMFVGILAGKVWIWMGEGRLKTYEQQPFLTSKVCCARFSIALLLSVSFDVFMVMYAVRAIRLTTGPSMMLLTALEFGVMTISSVSTAIHFAFSVAATFIIERRSQEVGTLTWNEKYRWMKWLTLTTGKLMPNFCYASRHNEAPEGTDVHGNHSHHFNLCPKWAQSKMLICFLGFRHFQNAWISPLPVHPPFHLRRAHSDHQRYLPHWSFFYEACPRPSPLPTGY